jgi:hypothetical protein
LTLERTISRISQDNVLTIAFHIVIGGDSTTLLARPAKRQDAPFEIGILRSASIGQPLHVIRRACRQETPFVPRTLLKEVFPDPGALHACSRRTLHPDARGNGIGRIAAHSSAYVSQHRSHALQAMANALQPCRQRAGRVGCTVRRECKIIMSR